MYQLLSQGSMIKRTTDGALIPMDANNGDYRVYLAWREEGGTPVPPPDLPAEELCKRIDIERDRRVSDRFQFAGVWFQCRPADVTNITGAGASALAALVVGAPWPADFVWIAEDNSLVPMTAAEVIAFGNAYTEFRAAIIFRAAALKARVRAGGTVDYLADAAWEP